MLHAKYALLHSKMHSRLGTGCFRTGIACLAQVTTLLLDKMRRIKNRMVRLKTRVETIQELLDKYLQDEGDMKNMNLSAK